MEFNGCDADSGRWKARFNQAHSTLEGVLGVLEVGEHDWSPDDGIATIRDHLWSIVESKRWVSGRLVRGATTPAQTIYRADDVDFEEIVRILGICHKSIVNWLESCTPDDARSVCEVGGEEPDSGCMSDLFHHHLELEAGHTAAIAQLTQLIDPARGVNVSSLHDRPSAVVR